MSNSSINIKNAIVSGENIGGGEGIFDTINPINNLQFKSLSSATPDLIRISSVGDEIVFSGVSVTGITSGGLNVGIGEGIYTGSSGSNLLFRSLQSLTPDLLTITGDSNHVMFSLTGVTDQVEQLEDLLLEDYFNIGEIKSKFQPILEPQAALTDSLSGLTQTGSFTPDYNIQQLTNTSPYGFVNLNEAETVISVIINLQTRVNELENRLQNLELLQQ